MQGTNIISGEGEEKPASYVTPDDDLSYDQQEGERKEGRISYEVNGMGKTKKEIKKLRIHVCVCVPSTRRHPAHPVSVPIFPRINGEIQVTKKHDRDSSFWQR